MKKILMILTDNSFDEIKSKAFEDQYSKIIKKELSFEFYKIKDMPSEDTTPKEWAKLCNYITKLNYDEYSGIIIICGNNTFTYTSALIGLMFNNLSIPIVVTTDNPISKSDIYDNLITSVEIFRRKSFNGVFSVYRDNLKNSNIHIATRIMCTGLYRNDFVDITKKPYATFKNDHISINQKLTLKKKYDKIKYDNITFDNDILIIHSYPGLNYNFIDLKNKNLKAILIKLYNSSTSCDNGCDYSLIEFIKKCKENNIDIYVFPFNKEQRKICDNSIKMLEQNAVPLCDISLEAAYIKLMIYYNLEVDDKLFLYDNIYFEQY